MLLTIKNKPVANTINKPIFLVRLKQAKTIPITKTRIEKIGSPKQEKNFAKKVNASF